MTIVQVTKKKTDRAVIPSIRQVEPVRELTEDRSVAELWLKYFKPSRQTTRDASRNEPGRIETECSELCVEPFKYRSVLMPPAFWEDLQAQAHFRNMSLHSLMRHMLLEWMARNQSEIDADKI